MKQIQVVPLCATNMDTLLLTVTVRGPEVIQCSEIQTKSMFKKRVKNENRNAGPFLPERNGVEIVNRGVL